MQAQRPEQPPAGRAGHGEVGSSAALFVPGRRRRATETREPALLGGWIGNKRFFLPREALKLGKEPRGRETRCQPSSWSWEKERAAESGPGDFPPPHPSPFVLPQREPLPTAPPDDPLTRRRWKHLVCIMCPLPLRSVRPLCRLGCVWGEGERSLPRPPSPLALLNAEDSPCSGQNEAQPG